MAMMNMGESDVTPNMEMGSAPEAASNVGAGMGGGLMDSGAEDDGVGQDEYQEDIIKNLESHLNSLPEEAKAFLAEYATTPEFAAAIGIINGEEVGQYFMKYADPNKTVTISTKPAEQAPAAQPNPQPAPAAQATASAPAPAAPQGGGLMKM